MENNAKKALEAGAIDFKGKSFWIKWYSDKCNLYTDAKSTNENMCTTLNRLHKQKSKIDIKINEVTYSLDYSKAVELPEAKNTEFKRYTNDTLIRPLLTKEELDLASETLEVGIWKELLYLSYGGVYYAHPELFKTVKSKDTVVAKPSKFKQTVNKIFKPKGKKRPKVNNQFNTQMPKPKLEAKEPVLRTPNKKAVKSMLLEFKAFKLPKKAIYGHSTKAERTHMRIEDLEQIRLEKIEKARVSSMLIQEAKLLNKKKTPVVIIPKKVQEETVRPLKVKGKKTKHLNKRDHIKLNKTFVKAPLQSRRIYDNQEDALADLAINTKFNKLLVENVNEKKWEVVVYYKKSRKYKCTNEEVITKRKKLKKNMNYVIPKSTVKKATIVKVPKTPLVCVEYKGIVYRLEKKYAAEAAVKLPGDFNFVNKSKWKEARLEGKTSFVLPIPTVKLVQKLKKKSKRNKLKAKKLKAYMETRKHKVKKSITEPSNITTTNS